MLAALNLWVFSRFTVDDAFITWRYGTNLIEHGVWNYNPVTFDLTQAYTNPIFAVLSIVPAALEIDVVLFFKLIAIAVTLLAIWGFVRLIGTSLTLVSAFLLFLFSPKAVMHSFSGLETMLYVLLLAFFLILLDRKRFGTATFLGCLLLMTRPEAWLLAALAPAFVFVFGGSDRRPQAITMGVVFAVVLGGYFAFHSQYFGNILPNTFYIKSAAAFSIVVFFAMLFVGVMPLMVALLARPRWVTGLAFTYSLIVVFRYSSSDLMMNYADRFFFHVLAPLYLFAIYKIPQIAETTRARAVLIPLVGFALVFAYSFDTRDFLKMTNYYPRLLDSHGALGHTLRQMSDEGLIETYSMGDAGIASYHAGIPALDSIGLGSQMVARNGMTPEVVRAYGPDVIVFHARADGILDVPAWYDSLLEYVASEGFLEVCDVFWSDGETLRVFTREDYGDQIETLCARSAARNDRPEWTYLWDSLRNAPWTYWRA